MGTGLNCGIWAVTLLIMSSGTCNKIFSLAILVFGSINDVPYLFLRKYVESGNIVSPHQIVLHVVVDCLPEYEGGVPVM